MGEDTTQKFPNSLDVILARFESMEGSLRSDIGSLGSRIDSFDLRLTALDEKVDRRLMETRPIWQNVLSRLDSIDKRLDLLESRMGAVESQMALLAKGFDRVETEVENLSLKFRAFQGDLLRMQTRDERLAERIEKLENPPAA